MDNVIRGIEASSDSIKLAGMAGGVTRTNGVRAKHRELQHSRVGGQREQWHLQETSDFNPSDAFLLNSQRERLNPLAKIWNQSTWADQFC